MTALEFQNIWNIKIYSNEILKYIPKEIRYVIDHKVIIRNIYRIHACSSIKCGYFYSGFIDFLPKGKVF